LTGVRKKDTRTGLENKVVIYENSQRKTNFEFGGGEELITKVLKGKRKRV